MSERKNKGWNNLRTEENSFALYDRDRLREVSRKGAEASHKARAEKKNAREALEKILSMGVTDEIIAGAELSPELAEQLKAEIENATIYDLMQLVAVRPYVYPIKDICFVLQSVMVIEIKVFSAPPCLYCCRVRYYPVFLLPLLKFSNSVLALFGILIQVYNNQSF